MTVEGLTGTPATAAVVTRPGVLDWVLVVLLTALAAVFGVFGIFFLPAYVGSVPMPVVVVVTSAALLVIPRVGYRLTGRMAAAMAPTAVWFAVSIGFYLTSNALYRGVPIAWRGWQFYLLIGAGAIAAATSLGLLWSEQVQREMDSRSGPDPERLR